MKNLLMFLFVIALSYHIFGQQNLEGRTINRGQIYTSDTEMIEGQYIVFSNDSIEYYLENSQTRYALGLDEVSEILEYDGNYGATGLLIGGLVGVGIGVVVALGTEETERTGFIETTTIQTWPIYVITAVGSLAGYFIGQGIEDWDTVYSKSSALLKNINIKQEHQLGLVVSYRVYL